MTYVPAHETPGHRYNGKCQGCVAATPSPDMKRCALCLVELPLTDFSGNPRGIKGTYSYCRPCNRAHQNNKRATNPRVREMELAAKARKRAALLAAYGGACACCGETEPKFLAIDHINNDGAAHRRELGGSEQVLTWLRLNNYPKENFQILCHNCNLAKGFYGGVCPHSTFRLVDMLRDVAS